MKLRNILLAVKDIEKSRQFYHKLFGLQTVLNSEGSELYFEEPEIEAFICKLETQYPSIQYVNRLTEYSWGQKMVRFYDLDGNLIEVRTPMYKGKL